MSNRFKDGFTSGVTAAPRPTTPDQERLAAEKVERGRALRAERRAKGELAPLAVDGQEQAEPAETLATGEKVSTGPQPDEPLSAKEQATQEWLAAQAVERADLMARASALHLEERYNFDAHTSLKVLRVKVADAEIEAGHAQQGIESRTTMPDDADYRAAKLAYQRATANVNELQAVEAGLPGRVQDAVNSGDFAALAEARQRQSLIGAELEAARFGALQARLAMQDAELPIAKVERTLGRIAATEAAEAIRKAQQEQYEKLAGANQSDERYAELRAARGDTLFAIEAMKADMLKAPPAQHQAPYSWRETGLQGLS